MDSTILYLATELEHALAIPSPAAMRLPVCGQSFAEQQSPTSHSVSRWIKAIQSKVLCSDKECVTNFGMTYKAPSDVYLGSVFAKQLCGNFRFIAVDVETAGYENSSICQIGLALVGFDNSIKTFSTYVDPCTRFAFGNTRLHGISAETVRGAPKFTEVLPDLRFVLETHPLVQHSRFDEKSFDAACRLAKLPVLRSVWTDSVAIARKAWPELRGNGGHGLANLKKVLGLQFRHHDAGEDARAAAEVILKAETTLGKSIGVLNSSQQLVFDF